MAGRTLRYLLGLSLGALLAGPASAFAAPVPDLDPPKVSAPPDIAVEASGPLTSVELGRASAEDTVGVVSLASDAPGAFPVGVTLVRWTAEDAAGNRAEAVQKVIVRDTKPPVVTGLKDITLEAESPGGAIGYFKIEALDAADGSPALKVSRPSGSVFPVGTTTVSYTATDKSGNAASGSFKVVVKDTVPPVLSIPKDLRVFMNTPMTAASVNDYLTGAKAEDAVDRGVPVRYSLSSPLDTPGRKTVTFTAADRSGNTSAATGTIWVGYKFNGFHSSESENFELGREVPVKFRLSDANGAPVPSAVAKLWLVSNGVVIDAGSGPECCGLFVYDDASGQYVYNLETHGLWPGEWEVRVELDDRQVRKYTLNLVN